MFEALHDIQHLLNPLHIYCRLIEKGFTKEESIVFVMLYEDVIYSPVLEELTKLHEEEVQELARDQSGGE